MKNPLGIIVIAILAAMQAASLVVAAVVLRNFSLAASLAALLGVVTSGYACVALLKRRHNAYLAVAAAGTAVLAFFAVMVSRVFALSDDPPAIESVLAASMVWIAIVLFLSFYVFQALRYEAVPDATRSRVPAWVWPVTAVIAIALIAASVLFGGVPAREAGNGAVTIPGGDAPKGAITYDLVSVNGQKLPWIITTNEFLTVEQTAETIHLEPGKTTGKVWTSSTLRTTHSGEEPQTRKADAKPATFVLDGDSLQIINAGRCRRTTIYTVADEQRVLRYRSYREEGNACENTPPQVRERLRAIRELPGEFHLRASSE